MPNHTYDCNSIFPEIRISFFYIVDLVHVGRVL